MSRCVDQVKYIFFSVFRLIYNTHGLRLDRNATLSLQIHVIQNLRLHLTACQKTGLLNDTVCQR